MAELGSRFERWTGELSQWGADLARGVLMGEALQPRSLFRNAMRAAQISAGGVAALCPIGDGEGAWREAANKLQAYRLFAFADTLDGQRLRALDAYSRLWATEGLGYYYAQQGIQSWNAALEEWPEREWIPLHTGLGLHLAEQAMASPGGLRDFADRCRAMARAGYWEPVFEAVGLITVTLFPDSVSGIGEDLSTDDCLGALFWHGVGRGSYFLPFQFLPWTGVRQRPLEFLQTAPRTEAGRENALAGLAWALTLVNIRDPAVIASWMRAPAAASDAFRNGVASALAIWLSSAGEESAVAGLEQFRGGERWDAVVGSACRDARVWAANGLGPSVFRIRIHVESE